MSVVRGGNYVGIEVGQQAHSLSRLGGVERVKRVTQCPGFPTFNFDLLNFVAASSCTFVRNGTEYPSDKAREHLATKYQFAGSRISTAEEFIRYLATQSSMSGELYHVKCGKADALSGVWLTNELKHYRETPRLQHVSR